MISIIARWIVNAIALYLVANIVPGIHVSGFGSALIAVVIIGFVNALIKPILFLLTLPITIVTLGLFSLILNALMLLLAGSVISGFRVDGFLPALIGSIVLSVITMILHALIR